MKNKFSVRCLTGFVLKIIAMIAMTIDHTGLFLANIGTSTAFYVGDIFRCIGRLALPIFIFLISEGVYHTKNEKRYFLRLVLLAFSFFIGQLFAHFVLDLDATSPIVDLVVAAGTLILLKRKDKFSFFAILPIAFAVLCFVVANIEENNPTNCTWLPFYIRTDYPLFSTLLAIGFFYSKPLATAILKSSPNTSALVDTSYHRYAESILCALTIVILCGIFYITYKTNNISYTTMPYQLYAIFSCVPILLYSGKRGYNKKWFQIACYIYVPAHLLIIAGIFMFILL